MQISQDGRVLISVLAEDIIDGVCREIPASVTHIGDAAFGGCTELTELTIPAGVTHIGDRAFEGCQALRAIIINGSEQEVQNIRGQLPAELRSRAISLKRHLLVLGVVTWGGKVDPIDETVKP